MFDPNQKSDGLALTCGNHCALKVGKVTYLYMYIRACFPLPMGVIHCTYCSFKVEYIFKAVLTLNCTSSQSFWYILTINSILQFTLFVCIFFDSFIFYMLGLCCWCASLRMKVSFCNPSPANLSEYYQYYLQPYVLLHSLSTVPTVRAPTYSQPYLLWTVQGYCCSCRSMLPIKTNAFVYLEFSVTVTGLFTFVYVYECIYIWIHITQNFPRPLQKCMDIHIQRWYMAYRETYKYFFICNTYIHIYADIR